MEVVKMAWTSPDWRIFQAITSSGLGRSVTRPIDTRNITDRDLAAYIASLGEFQKQGSDYITTLRDAGSLLKHVHVSFLVHGNREAFYDLAVDGDLDFLDSENEKLVIVSATLARWRTTIINYCSRRGTTVQQKFASAILLEFDKLGLSKLWETYSRSGKSESTLLIEKK